MIVKKKTKCDMKQAENRGHKLSPNILDGYQQRLEQNERKLMYTPLNHSFTYKSRVQRDINCIRVIVFWVVIVKKNTKCDMKRAENRGHKLSPNILHIGDSSSQNLRPLTCQTVTRGTDLSILSTNACWLHFLAYSTRLF